MVDEANRTTSSANRSSENRAAPRDPVLKTTTRTESDTVTNWTHTSCFFLVSDPERRKSHSFTEWETILTPRAAEPQNSQSDLILQQHHNSLFSPDEVRLTLCCFSLNLQVQSFYFSWNRESRHNNITSICQDLFLLRCLQNCIVINYFTDYKETDILPRDKLRERETCFFCLMKPKQLIRMFVLKRQKTDAEIRTSQKQLLFCSVLFCSCSVWHTKILVTEQQNKTTRKYEMKRDQQWLYLPELYQLKTDTNYLL